MNPFDDLNGRFEARLRQVRTSTHTSRVAGEGEITVSSTIAILETRFDLEVFDRLHQPSFVAVERKTKTSPNEVTYLIYEVVGLNPTHFQMLGMELSMPTLIRREYMDRISQGWEGSEETWLDITAIPTLYRMDLIDGEPVFTKSRMIPLAGSRVLLLNREAVKRFLCVEGGPPVGRLIGFELPLTIDIESLIRYHTGVFGFTGAGKSNLTSTLLREVIEHVGDVRIAIFDVAGEYATYLLDLLLEDGVLYSSEDFQGDATNLANSQAIPETLEARIGSEPILKGFQTLIDEGRVERISLAAPPEKVSIDLEELLNTLKRWGEGDRAGHLVARAAHQQLYQYVVARGLRMDQQVNELDEEDLEFVRNVLSGLFNRLSERLALRGDVESLIRLIEGSPRPGDIIAPIANPEGLASRLLAARAPRLNIIYLPEPDQAREVVARFIDRLLYLKKRYGARQKVLVVLDEAQEFIPDRVRREDFTDQSNRQVEALLRQGRKYRAYCWLCSQRVAHLNVNALQQLHSYFVSTLPRFYDRMVIADAFSLSYNILEKTTELETGEWLFVSYRATKQKNVPAFIKAQDNEQILAQRLTGS